jgi:hypothetical protein
MLIKRTPFAAKFGGKRFFSSKTHKKFPIKTMSILCGQCQIFAENETDIWSTEKIK